MMMKTKMNKKGGVKGFGYFMLALILASLAAIPFTVIPSLITAAITLLFFVKKKVNVNLGKMFSVIFTAIVLILFILATQSDMTVLQENGTGITGKTISIAEIGNLVINDNIGIGDENVRINENDNLEITPSEGPVKKIEFEGIELTGSSELGIDDSPESGNFAEVYALDPTAVKFDSAQVTVQASGNSLFKCKEWNFEKQICEGRWKKIQNIIPGEEYTFTLTAEDPGYGEGNYSVELLDGDNFLYNYTETITNLNADLGDVDLKVADNVSVINIKVNQKNLNEENKEIKLIKNNVNDSRLQEGFTLDASNVSFSDIEINKTAKGKDLLECINFDSSNGKCLANWTKVAETKDKGVESITSRKKTTYAETGDTVVIFDKSFNLLQYNEDVINENATSADVEYEFLGLSIKKVKFHSYNKEGGNDLIMEYAVNTSAPSNKIAKVFAVDPSNIVFSYAELSATAAGKYLFKCVEWNASDQTCFGDWKRLRELVPGEDYTINITSEDPGFLETNSSIVLINNNDSLLSYNETILGSVNNMTDLQLDIYNGTISQIVIYDHNESSSANILKIEQAVQETEFTQSYSIDPTTLSFSNATVTITASGNSLFKCKEWNFTAQECYGAWILVRSDLVPGQNYNFTLTAEDPGFGEDNKNVHAINKDREMMNGTEEVLENVSGKLKLKHYNFNSNKIREIVIEGYNATENQNELTIDENFTVSGFASSYAIDPTGLSFDNATVTVTASADANALYKCKEWNITTQTCYGEWVKLLDVVPGQNYTFELTPDDPGFAETNITTDYLFDIADTQYTAYKQMKNETVGGTRYTSSAVSLASAGIQCFSNKWIYRNSTMQTQFTGNWNFSIYGYCSSAVPEAYLFAKILKYNGTEYNPVNTTQSATDICADTSTPGSLNFWSYNVPYNSMLNLSVGERVGVQLCLNVTVSSSSKNAYIQWEGETPSNVQFPTTSSTYIPDVFLVSPVNNYTETSTDNVTFTYNVSDDSDIANCTIYIDGDADYNQTDTSITKDVNQTFSQVFESNGNYTWNITCLDSQGNRGWSANRNITLAVSGIMANKYIGNVILEAPASNPNITLGSSFAMNCSYNLAGNGVTPVVNISFEYNSSTTAWARINATTGLNTSGTNPVTATAGTVYTITVYGKIAGNYNIRCNASETLNPSSNISRIQAVNVTIDNPPYWSTNQTSIVTTYSPATPSLFNITWADDYGVSAVLLESNYSGTAVNYTMNRISGTATNGVYHYNATLPAGTFYWKSWANDTANQQNSSDSWTFTIAQATPTITKYLNSVDNDLTVTYPQQVNASGTTTGGTLAIYRDGTLINNGQNYTLGVGYYRFDYNVTGGQNYTNVSAVLYANVTQAAGSGALLLNGTAGDITLVYPGQVNVSFTNATGTGTLLRNGTDITNLNNQYLNLAVGYYNFTLNVAGNQNYTAFTLSRFANLTIAASQVNLTLNRTQGNATIAQGSTINLNCSLITPTSGVLQLYNNGTLINSGNSPIGNSTTFSSLGLFNITCIYPSTQNYSSSSQTYYVNVSDTTLPYVAIVYPANTTYNVNASELNYTASDTNLNRCWYSLNLGATNSTSVACGANWTGLTSAEGSNTWRVYANDTSGNLNSSSVTFFKDTIMPQINFTSPTEQTGVLKSRSWIAANVSINESNLANFTYRIYNLTSLVNATTFTSYPSMINWTGLANGVYYYNTTVYDTVGNFNSTETRNITLDTTPPYVVIASPANTTYTNATILVNITNSSDAAAVWFFNGTANESYSAPVYRIFTEGSNTLYAWANDSIGNLNSTSVVFAVDTIAPAIDFVSPTPSNGANISGIKTINVTANDTNLANITIFMNGTEVQTCSSSPCNFTLNTSLFAEQSAQKFNATARDSAGNSNSTATLSYTIDNTPPTVYFLTPPTPEDTSYINYNTINITAYVSDSSGIDKCTLEFNGTNTSTISPVSNLCSFIINDLPNGEHTFRVFANDTAGLTETTETRTFTVDTIIPQVQFEAPTETSGTTLGTRNNIAVNVTANDTNLESITIYLYDYLNALINSTSTAASPNFVNFTNLADGLYYFNATARDLTGNSNSTETRNVTITLDIVPPAISITYPQNTTYNVNVSALNYTVSDTHLQTCWYSLNNGVTNTSVTCGQNATNLTSSEGSNTWRVYANDTFGNKGLASVTFFKDTIMPSISIISPANATYNNRTLLVNISASDSGSGINSKWYNWNGTNVNYIIPEYVKFEEGSNTLYAYANDSAGNANTTNIIFNADTTPPYVAIANPLNQSYTNATILVNITNSGDAASVWFYNGTANESYTGAVYRTFAEGSRTLYAYANDTIGNLNSTSVAFFIDSIAPKYYNLTEPADPSIYSAGASYQFNATWIEDNAISTVLFEWQGTNYTASNISDVYYYVLNNLAVGYYEYKWLANDSLNNQNSTALLNFTVSKANDLVNLYINNLQNQNVSINYSETNVTATATSNTAKVYRDGAEISNPEIITLPPALYAYKVNSTGNQNYTANASGLTYYLNVSRAASVINLTLNNNNSNITVNPSTSVNITATLIVPSSGTLEIYEDSSLISSGGSPLSSSVTYNSARIVNITAVYSTTQNYTGSYETHWIIVSDIIAPNITNYSLAPRLVKTGYNITLNASATDNVAVSGIFVNITLPNSTVLTYTLPVNYTAVLDGRHNVTFWANDTSGNIATASDYFIAAPALTFNATTEDYNGTAVETNLTFYLPGTTEEVAKEDFTGNLTTEIPTYVYDLLFKAHSDALQVLLRDVNISADNNKIIGLDKLATAVTDYIVTYAVNNTYTITNATVTLSYSGTSYTNEDYLAAYKCNDWNFTAQECIGTWTEITDAAQDKTDNTFTFTVTSFSGFSVKQETVPSAPPSKGGGGGAAIVTKCNESWTCSDWSACIEGIRTRTCNDLKNCGTILNKPAEVESCAEAIVSCSNGIKDNDESDVDCGGTVCPACAIGKNCAADRDCSSGNCVNEICAKKITPAPPIIPVIIETVKASKIWIYILLAAILMIAAMRQILIAAAKRRKQEEVFEAARPAILAKPSYKERIIVILRSLGWKSAEEKKIIAREKAFKQALVSVIRKKPFKGKSEAEKNLLSGIIEAKQKEVDVRRDEILRLEREREKAILEKRRAENEKRLQAIREQKERPERLKREQEEREKQVKAAKRNIVRLERKALHAVGLYKTREEIEEEKRREAAAEAARAKEEKEREEYAIKTERKRKKLWRRALHAVGLYKTREEIEEIEEIRKKKEKERWMREVLKKKKSAEKEYQRKIEEQKRKRITEQREEIREDERRKIERKKEREDEIRDDIRRKEEAKKREEERIREETKEEIRKKREEERGKEEVRQKRLREIEEEKRKVETRRRLAALRGEKESTEIEEKRLNEIKREEESIFRKREEAEKRLREEETSIEEELEKARRNALLAEQIKEKELRKIENERLEKEKERLARFEETKKKIEKAEKEIALKLQKIEHERKIEAEAVAKIKEEEKKLFERLEAERNKKLKELEALEKRHAEKSEIKNVILEEKSIQQIEAEKLEGLRELENARKKKEEMLKAQEELLTEKAKAELKEREKESNERLEKLKIKEREEKKAISEARNKRRLRMLLHLFGVRKTAEEKEAEKRKISIDKKAENEKQRIAHLKEKELKELKEKEKERISKLANAQIKYTSHKILHALGIYKSPIEKGFEKATKERARLLRKEEERRANATRRARELRIQQEKEHARQIEKARKNRLAVIKAEREEAERRANAARRARKTREREEGAKIFARSRKKMWRKTLHAVGLYRTNEEIEQAERRETAIKAAKAREELRKHEEEIAARRSHAAKKIYREREREERAEAERRAEAARKSYKEREHEEQAIIAARNRTRLLHKALHAVGLYRSTQEIEDAELRKRALKAARTREELRKQEEEIAARKAEAARRAYKEREREEQIRAEEERRKRIAVSRAKETEEKLKEAKKDITKLEHKALHAVGLYRSPQEIEETRRREAAIKAARAREELRKQEEEIAARRADAARRAYKEREREEERLARERTETRRKHEHEKRLEELKELERKILAERRERIERDEKAKERIRIDYKENIEKTKESLEKLRLRDEQEIERIKEREREREERARKEISQFKEKVHERKEKIQERNEDADVKEIKDLGVTMGAGALEMAPIPRKEKHKLIKENMLQKLKDVYK